MLSDPERIAEHIAAVRGGTVELFDADEVERTNATTQRSGPLEDHLQKHIDGVRAQLHASAAQRAQLDEMRAHVKQLQLQLLQGEKKLEEQAYACSTLEQKFERARETERRARDDLAAAKAQLEQQERESLQALHDLRQEFAQRQASSGQKQRDSDVSDGDTGAASPDNGSEQTPHSTKTAMDKQVSKPRSLAGQSDALLRSIDFLRTQLAHHRPLVLSPPIDLSPLKRARHNAAADARRQEQLHRARMSIASQTIVSQ